MATYRANKKNQLRNAFIENGRKNLSDQQITNILKKPEAKFHVDGPGFDKRYPASAIGPGILTNYTVYAKYGDMEEPLINRTVKVIKATRQDVTKENIEKTAPIVYILGDDAALKLILNKIGGDNKTPTDEEIKALDKSRNSDRF